MSCVGAVQSAATWLPLCHRFLFANVRGGVAWAMVFSLIGYFVGNNWKTIEKYIGRAGILALVAGVIAIWMYRCVMRHHRHAVAP